MTVGKLRLPELLKSSVGAAHAWSQELAGKPKLVQSVGAVVEEIRARLGLLDRVGLAYLTLDRATATLSGGEARRVRLSASLGSQLDGVCYVLDEPTVGLHPRDTDALTDALRELRDARQHACSSSSTTRAVMERADWIVDLGPGAGRQGGTIVGERPAGGARARTRARRPAPRCAARSRSRARHARRSRARDPNACCSRVRGCTTCTASTSASRSAR